MCDSAGKTRTKDKYRVVYTDHQRLELEKEFQYNRYITLRRKTELSITLGLSERQVRGMEQTIVTGRKVRGREMGGNHRNGYNPGDSKLLTLGPGYFTETVWLFL